MACRGEAADYGNRLMETESERRSGIEATLDRVVGRRMRSVSMATLLSIVVLAITVTSLVVTAALSLTYGSDLAGDLAETGLESRAGLKASEVERYVRTMRNRAAALAESGLTADAAARFTEAFNELDSEPANPSEELIDFYRNSYSAALLDAFGVNISWRSLLPTTGGGIQLQGSYVVSDDVAEGEQRLLDDAGDGSEWSAAHRELHPRFLDIADRFGVEDIAIVEPANGTVVYSVGKAPDFATSLDVGPYSGSAFASVVRTIRNDPVPGRVAVVDLAPYGPQFGRPVGFVAAPIFDDGQLVGVVAMQFSENELNRIMTADGQWQDEGFGETGEAYLVGADGRMRSISRRFLEDSTSFLAEVEQAGTSTADALRIMALVGTTVTFQDVVERGEVDEATSETDATFDRTNYIGDPTTAAYAAVNAEGFEWGVLTEISRAELDAPVDDFRRAVVIAVSVFVILITFATVAWSGRVFRPLRSIGELMRRIHEGEDIGEDDRVDDGPREFVELADNIGAMLDALREREVALHAATEERINTVRSLLPPAIAERVEAGDRHVLDEIPQAGIAVVVFEGMGQLLEDSSHDDARVLLARVVEEFDLLADHHGLERVKVVGDAYVAGCGLVQPYLDHTPRAVAFALDALDACAEVSGGARVALGAAAGVHTGPVTVGLSGSTRLVYDLWGETADTAHFLARSALSGEVLVSREAADRLPSGYDLDPQDERQSLGVPVWAVSRSTEGVQA
jgi:class 3 adenylate cyclase